MCGIVSLISRRPNGFFQNDLELFENLLVLDTLRGLDSTGVFCVDSQRNVNAVKIASHPYNLFACDEWKAWKARANSIGRILVGHNRKATKGAVNSANAHPFYENNIVLVHNGSLREDHKKNYADVEVDSHALCHAFNEKGAENVIPDIDGAFALVWWDIEKQRLFAVRNDERPLSIVVTEELYILCSEPWMAQVLLSRQNRKVVETIDLKPGKLVEFKIGGEWEGSDIKLKEHNWENYTTRYQHGGAQPSVSHPKSSQDCGTGCGTGQGAANENNSSTKSSPTTTSHSGTVLTLVKGAPSSSPQTSPTDVAPDEHMGHVSCDDYPRHKQILVKFYESKLSDSKQFNILKGKSLEPDCEEVDVLSYVKVEQLSGKELVEVLAGPVLVNVVKHSTSLCGRSLYVNHITIPPVVEVHNGRITEHEWRHVTTSCKCKKCDAKIYEEEQLFTGVSRRANNKLSVTCADCIEDQLVGDFKYAFNQARLAAVQTSIAKREELAGRALGGAEASGPTTLH